MKSEEKFRVLTLDGGGMRGLYSATLLLTLAQRFVKSSNNKSPDLGKSFDLICGTSTGAILATAIAAGISLETIQNLYINEGKSIFTNPIPASKKKYWWYLTHLKRPSGNQNKLKDALIKEFNNETLGSLYKRRNIGLCVSSIDANNFRPRVFKTSHVNSKHRDDDFLLHNICLASSSAPIFFPLSDQVDPNNKNCKQYFVDGGLWINNPVLMGIIEALSILDNNDCPIEVISVGTCSKPSGDPKRVKNTMWGIVDWVNGNTLMEMTLAAQELGNTYMAQLLCDSLNKRNIPITVIRMEETNKAPEQYSAIGLDKSDEMAIQTLIQLAIQDADNIHSKSLQSHVYDPIKDIFSNLSFI
jgi:patatin-like phospholipase/acyl hydrolase